MPTIPATLTDAIVAAAGRHLAVLAADAGAKPPYPVHPEDAANALRAEAREALRSIDLKDLIAEEVGSSCDLAELAREEVERIVEREIDVEQALDACRDELARDLSRQAEDIDIDEVARDVVAERMDRTEIREAVEAATRSEVAGFLRDRDARDAVVQAAGAVLATAVVDATQEQAGDPPAAGTA